MNKKDKSKGVRDGRYNTYIRDHGKEMWYMDLDGVHADIDGNPLLLCELKHGCEDEINLNSWQFKVLRKMAEASQVPLIVVRYWLTGLDPLQQRVNLFGNKDFFEIIPANKRAVDIIGSEEIFCSARKHAELIFKLRGEPKSPEFLAQYSDFTPWGQRTETTITWPK